jgi:hypothetical protein
MIYRYHCIRRDGYNYTVSPYFIDYASERSGINIVGVWRIKKYVKNPAPELTLETSARDMYNFKNGDR